MTEYEVTEAMIAYGGNFVRQLGMLIRAADADNKRRLVEAFPEYLEKYRELARRRCRHHHYPDPRGDVMNARGALVAAIFDPQTRKESSIDEAIDDLITAVRQSVIALSPEADDTTTASRTAAEKATIRAARRAACDCISPEHHQTGHAPCLISTLLALVDANASRSVSLSPEAVKESTT